MRKVHAIPSDLPCDDAVRHVARKWCHGRISRGRYGAFFPPTGGFGTKTGIQDVRNLAWKLALVLRGQADDKLLDTYEVERIGVARTNADWSLRNGARIHQRRRAIRRNDDEQVVD
ncbi:FAD-dependent monooxygenase [Nocardia sp. CY41]|uniref:FAD-dependent monooxygenase n=1 Tax=Nocardia sp. CY41 TaxID=2608686 RepID=UPI00135B4042